MQAIIALVIREQSRALLSIIRAAAGAGSPSGSNGEVGGRKAGVAAGMRVGSDDAVV
jgi:hypothetical protein